MNFNLGTVNATRAHLFSDAVEILCLIEQREHTSLSDISSILNQNTLPAEDFDLEISHLEESGYEITSRQDSLISECMRHLAYRFDTFGEFYPFEVSSGALKAKDQPFKNFQKYIFLLISSRTRSFQDKGFTVKVASAFEEVSFKAFSELFPKAKSKFMFGPSYRKHYECFSGDLRADFPVLAKLLGVNLGPKWSDRLSANGDGRIDLFASHGLANDGALGDFGAIAQCAAYEDERDWHKKRSEADIKYLGRFHAHVVPFPILFIPGCYREPDGSWINEDFIGPNLLIDRLRILSLLGKQSLPKNCKSCVNEVFRYAKTR